MIIKEIDNKGVLSEMGVEAGDKILSINGIKITDYMDYRFSSTDTDLMVIIEKPNKEIWELEIEKDENEDLGIIFGEEELITRLCKNKCIFCFVDQMPKGMRETLYVKDDDERLSFLQGNYVTLTNLTQKELERIVTYRIMPINISIHTTNRMLRCKMLKNRFAGNVIECLQYFFENKITMNGQIVLCPGYNDESELQNTLLDLIEYYPYLQSVSVVPVGIGKHRKGLTELTKVDKEIALKTIEILSEIQKKMQNKFGVNFVYASDEFYILAEKELPNSDFYDGFPQIENGVGMISDFRKEFYMKLRRCKSQNLTHTHIGIITGKLAHSFIESCVKALIEKNNGLKITIFAIENNHFGKDITVSGLITGKDILEQLKPIGTIEKYLIPENMLRSNTNALLDDMTTHDLEKYLKAPVKIIPVNGSDFYRAIVKE